jgi:glycosyltransferase involved in cell wall biosynthesis
VLPTFNRYAMVSRAIRSVLSQTFQKFELIVVDDHSTAYGEAAFSEFQDSRLTVVQNRRSKGACGARNTGFDIANGEWVAFLDDDDEWLPDKLSLEVKCISSFAPDSNVVMIYSDSMTRDGEKEYPTRRPSRVYFPDLKRNLLYANYVGGMSIVTGRLSVCRAAGGFDETLPGMQDLDFFVRLAAHGAFRHIPQPSTVRHVGHDCRITDDANKKLVATRIVRDKYRTDIEESFRLRYMYKSREYHYSVLAGYWKQALKACPWFAAGLILDGWQFRQNASVTVRAVAKHWLAPWVGVSSS